ncbi:hypothetical protein CPB85DRAFT_3187 [Mucidula mucida]|nr:hypothetical protein CPB85DRAFT_3187 [Mucidula mucida]
MSFEPMLARSTSFGADQTSVTDSPFMPMSSTIDGMEYLTYPPSPSPAFNGAINGSNDFDIMGSGQMDNYMYTASPFSNTEPQPYMPENELSISPRAMVSNLSDGERSSGRRSRNSNGSAGSPPSLPYSATVPRSVRYDPVPASARRNSTTSRRAQRARRRRNSDESDEYDEDEEYHGSNTSGGPVETRRESVRQQRIESEQKRRDELRKHYDLLREVLPAQQVRLSKVAILAKATEYIRELSIEGRQTKNLVDSMSAELAKMRRVHDSLVARALANPALHLGEY